jgi:hypothetical protein
VTHCKKHISEATVRSEESAMGRESRAALGEDNRRRHGCFTFAALGHGLQAILIDDDGDVLIWNFLSLPPAVCLGDTLLWNAGRFVRHLECAQWTPERRQSACDGALRRRSSREAREEADRKAVRREDASRRAQREIERAVREVTETERCLAAIQEKRELFGEN